MGTFIHTVLYLWNLKLAAKSHGILKTIYFTMIHSRINYGVLVSGNAIGKHITKIATIQKKAIRIINKVEYNRPTAQLF